MVSIARWEARLCPQVSGVREMLCLRQLQPGVPVA